MAKNNTFSHQETGREKRKKNTLLRHYPTATADDGLNLIKLKNADFSKTIGPVLFIFSKLVL